MDTTRSRFTPLTLAVTAALTTTACMDALEATPEEGVTASAAPSGDHPELYGAAPGEGRPYDVGGNVDWGSAPWPAGTCLIITQGTTGVTHSDLPGCPIDLDDGCNEPGHTPHVCGFDSCRVVTPCRSGWGWGTNACLVDVATGAWQFLGHMYALAAGVGNGTVLHRDELLGGLTPVNNWTLSKPILGTWGRTESSSTPTRGLINCFLALSGSSASPPQSWHTPASRSSTFSSCRGTRPSSCSRLGAWTRRWPGPNSGLLRTNRSC